MGNRGDIYLGELGSEELLTPFGRVFSIKDEIISREGRAADGTLRRDVIATKKLFTLEYSLIGETDIESLIDLYELETELSLLVYNTSDEGGTTAGPGINYDQYTVLMNPFDRTRLLLAGDGLWTGLTVELREV